MKKLPSEMLDAAHLVKTGQLTEATAVLRRLLGRQTPLASAGSDGVHDAFARIGDLLNGARLPDWQPPTASPPPPDHDSAASARFLNRSFSNHGGSRPYKLYVPSGYWSVRPLDRHAARVQPIAR